jgi:hypothetical protein
MSKWTPRSVLALALLAIILDMTRHQRESRYYDCPHCREQATGADYWRTHNEK